MNLTLVPCRAMAPGVLDSEILRLQTLEHLIRVSRTWDSAISLLPKGGDTIWGNLDWSPEEGNGCDFVKKGQPLNNSNGRRDFQVKDPVKYGRMISFGKAASQLPSSQLPTHDSKVLILFFFFFKKI